MASSTAEPPPGQWNATCIVVTTSRLDAPAAASVEQLVASLDRRGLTVVRSGDAFDAMASLVEHERLRRAGRKPEPLVMVLVDPSHQPNAADLFNSTMRYGPSTAFWEFQSGPSHRLTAYRPPPAAAPPPALSIAPPPTPIVARGVSTPRASERQPLRLTHEAEVEALPLRMVGSREEEEPGAPGAALVTDEELSMLLGEGNDEGWSGGARA
ncbi:MAG: hypothetical protein JNK58_02550 [Phycisphaerae bacterium]|nr:hypothetical protein [Phycisphaerae bacterium]